MFGVSTTELTPELEQESEENKAWFRSMSAACIPSGARLKWCHQCEAGEEHLAHASEEQKRASREAYEKLLTQP